MGSLSLRLFISHLLKKKAHDPVGERMSVCEQFVHDRFMAAAPGDCGAPALSPLLTSHPRLPWECVSMSPSSLLLISH